MLDIGTSNTHSNGYGSAGHKTLDSSSSSKRQMIASYANGNKEVQSLELRPPTTRRILVVDDDPDITLTFKKVFEAENENSNNKNIFFVVNTYNDPLLALSEFKPSFYDLLLVDINMPKMNGFEFSVKVLEIDVNPRVCFMSSGLINQEALKEQYPALSIGCFIKKPVSISYLVSKVKAELE
jgi:CheY-like chemotaxis protein